MKINNDIAELVGITIGDGCLSTKNEYVVAGDINEEKDYYDEWVGKLLNQNVTIPLINQKVTPKSYPKVGVYGFYLFNKKITNFFKSLGLKEGSKINVKIPENLLKNKVKIKRVLRGIFDTDGSLYFDKMNKYAKFNTNPVIALGSTSKILINQIYNLLISLNFSPIKKKPYLGKRDKNPMYRIALYRKNEIFRWINEIGFKNPKHITKWKIYLKYGYYLPKTTIAQRKLILSKGL
mgnify:CR=1 FL=1